MRVVFDTNILVSALAFPGGRGEEALLRIIERHDHLVISREIIHELLAVLARKFKGQAEELARTAVFLAEIGEVVEPTVHLEVLEDKPDNRIIECAVAGQAEVLVTGDRKMLDLGECQGVRIPALREYLESGE